MHQRGLSACLALALLAGPASAQQPDHEQHHPGETPPGAAASGPGMQGGGMPMRGMMRMMMGEDEMPGMRMMAAMAGHVEGRLAFLKTELKITDAQLPLWDAVADVIRANARSMRSMAEGMMGSAQTAALPDRLAAREKMMSAHLDALRKFKAAIDPLYAAFSDEQKKTADELLMGPMGMM